MQDAVAVTLLLMVIFIELNISIKHREKTLRTAIKYERVIVIVLNRSS